jgi:hypothetical protein
VRVLRQHELIGNVDNARVSAHEVDLVSLTDPTLLLFGSTALLLSSSASASASVAAMTASSLMMDADEDDDPGSNRNKNGNESRGWPRMCGDRHHSAPFIMLKMHGAFVL